MRVDGLRTNAGVVHVTIGNFNVSQIVLAGTATEFVPQIRVAGDGLPAFLFANTADISAININIGACFPRWRRKPVMGGIGCRAEVKPGGAFAADEITQTLRT